MGDCADIDNPRIARPMPGRGFGLGWEHGRFGDGGYGWGGGGRGRRHRFYAAGRPFRERYSYGSALEYAPSLTPEKEVESLKSEAMWLKGQLDAISQRLEELE